MGTAVPIGNQLEILGTSVAAGTTPVQTTGSGNTITTQVQTSQAIAASDATKIGLAAFDSASFDVDVNGFVTLNGGGIAATSFDVQSSTAPGTDPVVPTAAGAVTVNGAAVANHGVVLETHSRAANAFNVEVQYATTSATTDDTKSGVCHFDESQFNVDADGFVTLQGSGAAIDSIGVDATSGAGTNPVLPTVDGLVTNNGATVAAGTNPVRTVSTAANVYQTQVQISQALAAADATKIGLSNFNSTHFSVDANGFVAALSGGLFSWVEETTATRALLVNQGVVGNRGTAQTFTLPATAAQFSIIRIVQVGAGAITIAQNAGDQIRFGAATTTAGAGGTLTSTSVGDAIELINYVASDTWVVLSAVGTWIPV